MNTDGQWQKYYTPRKPSGTFKMIEEPEYIHWPDGSTTTTKWENKVDERIKVLAEGLFEIQRRMPDGQMWSLYSHGACRQIAEHLDEELTKMGQK